MIIIRDRLGNASSSRWCTGTNDHEDVEAERVSVLTSAYYGTLGDGVCTTGISRVLGDLEMEQRGSAHGILAKGLDLGGVLRGFAGGWGGQDVGRAS